MSDTASVSIYISAQSRISRSLCVLVRLFLQADEQGFSVSLTVGGSSANASFTMRLHLPSKWNVSIVHWNV